MLPRTLQTSNGLRPGSGLINPITPARTPQATASSTLPGSHNRISFPILTPQQKRQQLQQQGNGQNQLYQTSEDEKHIVLQIKHGNSTTMEKSPNGKSETVHKGSNGSAAQFTMKCSESPSKHGGLVPYYDDDDSESDSDIRKSSVSIENKNGSKKSARETQSPKVLTPSGESGGSIQTIKGSSSENHLPWERDNGDASKKLLPGHSQIFPPNPKKSAGLTPKAAATVSPSFARSLSSSPLPKSAEDRKWLLSRQNSASPSCPASASALSSGKAGLIAPLELPVVTTSASHPSSGSVIKTSNGTWHVQPQDTGAPSPRGSCSSANSVNSTTEWTLQSKGNFSPHFDLSLLLWNKKPGAFAW